MVISLAVVHSTEAQLGPQDLAGVRQDDIAFVEVTLARIIDFFDFSLTHADVTSHLYFRAAERGHVGAQATIGDRYSLGRGVEYDIEKAVEWWQKAAEQKNLRALESLVEHYRKTNDLTAQIKWTRLAAEAGVLRGQIMLAWYYQHGQGVVRDADQAIKWYSLAVDRGDPLAHTNLARIYEGDEDGDREDLPKAYQLHIQAIALGSGDGLRHLTNLLRDERGSREDQSEGFRAILEQAKAGSPVAQFYAGTLLLEGKGTQKSEDDAVQWYLSSADQGYVYSQLELAWCYEDGLGVPQDLELAFFWRMAAANQGNASAQLHISKAYARGQGVGVDMEQSLLWARSAAEQGLSHAQSHLGYLYLTGIDVEEDLIVARRWFRLAASQGDGYSIEMLARSYFNNLTTGDDIANALMWLNLGAAAGSQTARLRLEHYETKRSEDESTTVKYLLMHATARAAVWEQGFRAKGGEFETFSPYEPAER